MYRLIVESLLGLQRTGTRLQLLPVIPADWPGFSLRYRFGSALYVIEVEQRVGVAATLHLDGVLQQEAVLELLDDGREHQVHLLCPPVGTPALSGVAHGQ
jgi:cellobiose phosphorylase